MQSDVVHWPGLADAAEPDKPAAPVVSNNNGIRPQARLDESLTGAKIDMVQVRDDGTGWADDSSDEEMTYDEDQPLFDDMPVASSPSGDKTGDQDGDKNGESIHQSTEKKSAPSSPKVPASPSDSPQLVPEESSPASEDLSNQNEVMKSTAQQARERREAEEREQERLRKERADAKLKQLEDTRSTPVVDAQNNFRNSQAVVPEAKPPPNKEESDAIVRPNGAAPDISKQEQVMKSTAQQARERREAEEREQERLRKERADAKLKELEAKRQHKMKEDEDQQKKVREEQQRRAQQSQHPPQQQNQGAPGDSAGGDGGAPIVIMERPREQSRFNLWVDPDSTKQKKDTKHPGKETAGRSFDTAAVKYKPDDRDWRARDPAGSQPSQNFTLARRPNEQNNSDSNKPNGKSNQDGSKQNRRDKEQKKREQAASLIDIPKPLPIGASAPQDVKQSADGKKDANADGFPSMEWPVKRLRKFCEEHLVPVTRTDSAEQILKKIEHSRLENGGNLKHKGQKKKPLTETPKPRPSGAVKADAKEDDRRDRRREREAKSRDRRKKDTDDKSADKTDGETNKDKTGKDKDREKDATKEKDSKDKDQSKDKQGKADDKAKAGVPTLEAQGLQPIADGLMVGMGVAVAAGEVVQDHSGFTTVTTGDKNQRKEEQRKREAQREREIRDEKRREKEEQRRREKQAIKIPAPAPAPAIKGQVQPPQSAAENVTREDLLLVEDLDLALHDAPRPHSIQDLNQQAVPKVAWGGTDSANPTAKKPVSLLQVQVEEKFNKRLDPQHDAQYVVEREPQRQGSSSAIGSERRDGPNPNASDPWAQAPGSMPVNDQFSSAFQSAIGTQTVPLSSEFNALQGLNMLQIRPSGHAVSQTQPFSTAPAPNQQQRFQPLGLAMLGTNDNPFASAFGAPPSVDGWSSAPGVHGGSNPFAAPGAEMSFVPEGGGGGENAATGRWSSQPRNAVGHQRAVGGGKRGAGGVQVAPGPAAPGQGSVSDAAPAQHGHTSKRHGRHGKGGTPGPVGAPSGGDNNSGGGKGKHKNNSGKQGGGRRARGPKDSGDNGGATGPAATPRPAGSGDSKGNNNRRGPRRGGGNAKQRGGDKGDSGTPAPVPLATPATSSM
jgi:hypothetical protein